MLNRSHRRGMASIEYVAFLPLFIILFGWLMTVTSAAFTQLDAEMKARRSVWENRFDPPKKMVGPKSVDYVSRFGSRVDLLARGVKPSSRFFIKSHVDQSGPSFFRDFAVRTHQENFLVGGSWDYRQVKFQTEWRHGKLIPDKLLGNLVDRSSRFFNFLSFIRGEFDVQNWFF